MSDFLINLMIGIPTGIVLGILTMAWIASHFKE